MEGLIQKCMGIALTTVLGLWLAHPATWRVELAKFQYSILKETISTQNWGNPSIFKHHRIVKK